MLILREFLGEKNGRGFLRLSSCCFLAEYTLELPSSLLPDINLANIVILTDWLQIDRSFNSGSWASKTTGSCGNCVFPFIYNRRESDRCTTVDGKHSPWCATSVDSSGNMVSWEYCSDSSCPGMAASNSPPMTVHPENAAGKCCKLNTIELFILIKHHI